MNEVTEIPTNLEKTKIPFRYLPINVNMVGSYANAVLAWIASLKDNVEVELSKDLSYMVQSASIPIGPIEINSRLIRSFISTVLVSFLENEMELLSPLLHITHAFPELTSYLIFFNSMALEFDPWFDDSYIVVCPCLFGKYVSYPSLRHKGVKLQKVQQFAWVNFCLDNLKMDWNSFNHNFITKNSDYIHEANRALHEIFNGSLNLGLPAVPIRFNKNIYQCTCSKVNISEEAISVSQWSKLQDIADSIEGHLQNDKRRLEEEQSSVDAEDLEVEKRIKFVAKRRKTDQ